MVSTKMNHNTPLKHTLAIMLLSAATLFSGYFFLAHSLFSVAGELDIPPFVQRPSTQEFDKSSIQKSQAPYVQIGETQILVELATSTAAVQKGLSGRTSLASDHGMFFVFEKPNRYRFWMPDMHFPIDIIWIMNNKVVDIEHDISQEFDPKNPHIYIPSEPVQHILEVNAGFAKKHHIRIGDRTRLYLR